MGYEQHNSRNQLNPYVFYNLELLSILIPNPGIRQKLWVMVRFGNDPSKHCSANLDGNQQ